MRLCMILIFLVTWQSISWANDEYSLYQNQGSRCGEKNDYIVKEAFQNYNKWKTARDNGYQAPKNTFRTAGQQFEYLYKNGCDDGLILYRYGNMMRHNNKCNESILILLESIKDLKINYPSYVSWAYYSLGMCSTTIKKYDDSIKYYKQSIQYNPDDVDSRINLAHRLYWKGALDESLKQCNYVLHHLSGITSSYGKKKCKEIIDMIESSR
ncbi:MAG: hypothetical protein KOO65_05220 [Desulfobacterales bacterium]|nr:hypothetical protein [Desulfobacterales bacterium]